ncbi:MAG: hypothetical protein ACK45B_04270 [Limisphaerales bacterium]
MDWQQVIALTIVTITAAAFVWARARRRRKAGLPCDSGCGCGATTPPRETVIYHARKGQRPEVIVRAKPQDGRP